MSLGERIYRLRTEKNLSQGDLAELLAVSRQSISKWENNSAVPELEKIIKLSEIFEVSIDELVKGAESTRKSEPQSSMSQEKVKETGFSSRKIAGTILLCIAFVVEMFFLVAGGGLAGLIFALPFLICGILCFILKKNVGLWCAWTVYVLLDIYMAYATGISRASILYTFQWTPQMNYMRLAIAWVAVLSLAVIVGITVVRLGKEPFVSNEKGRKNVIFAWCVVVLIQYATTLWVHTSLYQHMIESIFEMAFVVQLISIVISWSKIISITVALVFTAKYVGMKKKE